jgi:hypothetical protein
MITFKLFLWSIPIIANILWDRYGRKPHYLVMFLLRGVGAILHAKLFNPTEVNEWIVILIFQVTSYWLFFEAGLNFVQHRALLYYDTVERDSGWIDKFFAWTGYKAHAFAKGFAFGAMVFSIIKIYMIWGN